MRMLSLCVAGARKIGKETAIPAWEDAFGEMVYINNNVKKRTSCIVEGDRPPEPPVPWARLAIWNAERRTIRLVVPFEAPWFADLALQIPLAD